MSARLRLLIIKTSSLGDVVHALPAISDIARARPGWQIDWICEEAFADIPALHPAVSRVIPCAIRRWRRSWWSAQTRNEVTAMKSALREPGYDMVLDLQGLLKSAWIARQARGTRHGYAWNSAREPLASLAYDVRHVVAWGQHAIARNRLLAAAALGYVPDGAPRYGVMPEPRPARGATPRVVALHATSRTDKLWPEDRWRDLLRRLSAQGYSTVLPWGSPTERERGERLAAGIAGAEVPARMAPAALAALFATARVVIGVDTGLVHLAVAAGAPTLALFGPTEPGLTGVVGERAPAISLGGHGVFPEVAQVEEAVAALLRPAARSDAPGGPA